MDDYLDDRVDATATQCRDCGETTYWEFDNCHHCGWDLNAEPEED